MPYDDLLYLLFHIVYFFPRPFFSLPLSIHLSDLLILIIHTFQAFLTWFNPDRLLNWIQLNFIYRRYKYIVCIKRKHIFSQEQFSNIFLYSFLWYFHSNIRTILFIGYKTRRIRSKRNWRGKLTEIKASTEEYLDIYLILVPYKYILNTYSHVLLLQKSPSIYF